MPLLLALTTACAASSRVGAPPAGAERPSPPSAPRTQHLPRVVIGPEEMTDLPTLMREAEAAQRAGRHADAARRFDRVVELEPDGALAPEALYQAGVARDELAERGASIDRFELLVARFPRHALARQAMLRLLRLTCYTDRWARAGALADRYLQRWGSELATHEAVVVYGAKALALVEGGDADGGLRYVERARTVIEAARLDAAGTISRDVAQVYFALGEVRRLRAEQIVFDPAPADFGATLEARAQLVLDAQSAYSDAMRAHDAHWSTMAGFRIGELYQKLHRDILRLPVPSVAETLEQRQLFEGAMRLRYSILLEKGLDMVRHTLSMVARTGEDSEWVRRLGLAERELLQGVAAEHAALDKLPYTRAQLQQALTDLAVRRARPR